MELNNDKIHHRAYYRAVQSHDSRFDGRFFVGVKTTKIYCRPICTVKTPKFENCLFFRSHAAAESNGFRPCLRCRPELAPGFSEFDAKVELARKAAKLIDESLLEESKVPDLAERLNVSDRHLRRVFHDEFGVSVVEYLQTRRLLCAKQLLADTRMPITDVAFASGFSSVRRFNALIKNRYRLNPTQLRPKNGNISDSGESIELLAQYRPPFLWKEMLKFLEARSIPNVEWVQEDRYYRTVEIKLNDKIHRGWICCRNDADRNSIRVKMSTSLSGIAPVVLDRVRSIFDLNCDPHAIADVFENFSGLRVPGCFDGFEMSMRALLGQQISVKAARTIAGRMAEKFGNSIETPHAGLSKIFPSAAVIAAARLPELQSLGLPSARALSIRAFAQAVCSGFISLKSTVNVEETIQKLITLPGIGGWTAQYIAMRALSWPDAFPYSDLGIKKALKEQNDKKIIAIAEKWRPWRSYAVIQLWHSLSET